MGACDFAIVGTASVLGGENDGLSAATVSAAEFRCSVWLFQIAWRF
jgi:hypothetical protein